MPQFRLGNLGIDITSEHAVGRLIAQEFASIQDSLAPETPALTIDFSQEFLPPIEYYSVVKPFLVSDRGKYQVAAPAHTYQVSTYPDGARYVHIWPRITPSGRSRHLPHLARRFRDWTYFTDLERAAKDFIYGVFDHVSQVTQLGIGQTYIHASAVAKGGSATLFPAWGGIGKTSAMLRLVQRHNFEFLGDDLALIDHSGTVYRHPKRMQIYAYNLQGDPELAQRLLAGRSRMDRLSWKYRLRQAGPAGVRRRVAAEEIFRPSNLGHHAHVAMVIWLSRTSELRPKVREISVEELAHRAAWTLVDEISPFGSVSCAVNAAGSDAVPTMASLATRIQQILNAALDGLPLQIAEIPEQASPQRLIDILRDYCGLAVDEQ